MIDFLSHLSRIAMLVFLLAGMVELGLGLAFHQLLAPLGNAARARTPHRNDFLRPKLIEP